MQRRSCHFLAARPIASIGSAGEEPDAVQTFSGQRLNVREDGTVNMSADDAEYLIRDGWTKLAQRDAGEDS
jgi:hypothetical protein